MSTPCTRSNIRRVGLSRIDLQQPSKPTTIVTSMNGTIPGISQSLIWHWLSDCRLFTRRPVRRNISPTHRWEQWCIHRVRHIQRRLYTAYLLKNHKAYLNFVCRGIYWFYRRHGNMISQRSESIYHKGNLQVTNYTFQTLNTISCSSRESIACSFRIWYPFLSK